MARHAQFTQRNTFAISLQYLKKKMSDEADLLHADKHESSLHESFYHDFDGDDQVFPKFPK